MESACAPESGAPPPPALSFLTATPAGTTSGNHARGGGAHHGGGGVGPPPQLDDAGAQPGDAAAASRDSTVVHRVPVAGPGAAAAAAAAVVVTASADRMGPLAAEGPAVDADMEGVGGGGAAAAMTSPQPPPASTRAVVATVGPHVQRPPRKRLHCHRVLSSTVTARAGAATAAARACSSAWLPDRTRLSRTRSSPRRQGAFSAAVTEVAGAVSTRRSAGRRQGAARRRAARRPGCGHLCDGAHRGPFRGSPTGPAAVAARIPGVTTAGGDMGGSNGASLPAAGMRTERNTVAEAPAAAPPRAPPTPSPPTGGNRTPRSSQNAATLMCSAGRVAAGVALSHKWMSRMAEWRSGGRPKTQTVTAPPSTDGVARRKPEGGGGDPVKELGAAAGRWVAGWGWGARTRPTTATATTWPPAELSRRLVATKGEEEGHRQQGETGSGDRCTSQTCDRGR